MHTDLFDLLAAASGPPMAVARSPDRCSREKLITDTVIATHKAMPRRRKRNPNMASALCPRSNGWVADAARHVVRLAAGLTD
ncbi:hypothetical protein PSA5_05425 [Pseudomonas syringae pv. actinidiae]|nr:hypothetical protein PSA5_05425 [Pseudomonas syringae pv. actinidiae]